MDKFIIHSCEQMLRFSRVKEWGDLSEERKVQLGFNMGVMAHGLNLSKEDSYTALSNLREGVITMPVFREHIQSIVNLHQIEVDEVNISKPF
jgi:hypothetical protein